MKKFLLILVLLFSFQKILYANKTPIYHADKYFDVDEWIVEVKNFYNQIAGVKIGKSNISFNDAENLALKACKEDKIFNANKPEGCLVFSKKETYERSLRYSLGLEPPEPIVKNEWEANARIHLAKIKMEQEKTEDQKKNLKMKPYNKASSEKNYDGNCIKLIAFTICSSLASAEK